MFQRFATYLIDTESVFITAAVILCYLYMLDVHLSHGPINKFLQDLYGTSEENLTR